MSVRLPSVRLPNDLNFGMRVSCTSCPCAIQDAEVIASDTSDGELTVTVALRSGVVVGGINLKRLSVVAPKPSRFGDALALLKDGKRVARSGWNGKGMWLWLVPANRWDTKLIYPEPGVHRLPWIGMKTADGGFVPWLASQTDLLADDWMEVSS